MKKKSIVFFCTLAVAGVLAAGCGQASDSANTEAADGGSLSAELSVQETEGEAQVQETDTEAEQEADGQETETEASGSGSNAETTDAALEDGVYTADFTTDSSMFHVNEAYDGKGTLTVENGEMVIHITLVSQNIVNLYPGTAEDAQKDGADYIEPTEDTVTYSDGTSEVVYGFDVPVAALDEEFDLAIIGTRGTWYDHKVSVSNPEPAE